MRASDFRRSASLADSHPQLLEELDRKLSAAQQVGEELDEVPLVVAWMAAEKGEAGQGREGSSRARAPFERFKMRKRQENHRSRYRGYVASVAALLALVVVGVCAAGLNDSGDRAFHKTVQAPVAYDQEETQSTASAASSMARDAIGTMEVDKIDLARSGKGSQVLEASVTVFLSARADGPVALSFEDAEGIEVAAGFADDGIGGPFVVRCPLPEVWNGDGASLSPLQRCDAFVQIMKGYTIVVKGSGVEERVKIDLNGLEDDEVQGLLASEYEENGGIVVLNLTSC